MSQHLEGLSRPPNQQHEIKNRSGVTSGEGRATDTAHSLHSLHHSAHFGKDAGEPGGILSNVADQASNLRECHSVRHNFECIYCVKLTSYTHSSLYMSAPVTLSHFKCAFASVF